MPFIVAIKNVIKFRIAITIGGIAILGIWILLGLWAYARYYWAKNWFDLDWIMDLWELGFVVLFPLGVVLLLWYGYSTSYSTLRNEIGCLLVYVIAFNSFGKVNEIRSTIQEHVFVKLINGSGIDLQHIKLEGKWVHKQIGELPDQSAVIVHYKPPFTNADGRWHLKPDTLHLLFQNDRGFQDSIAFSQLTMGNCRHFLLDDRLDLNQLNGP